MDNKKIGENFKKIREQRGLTIVDFSNIMKCSKSSWSRIENGDITNDDIVNTEPFESSNLAYVFTDSIEPVKEVVRILHESIQPYLSKI